MYCTNFYDLPLLHEGGVICSIHTFWVPSAGCFHTFDAHEYTVEEEGKFGRSDTVSTGGPVCNYTLLGPYPEKPRLRT